jgi:hypothetical protein
MPFDDAVILPTVKAINNHVCTLYPNNTMIADNGWLCYQSSNSSWIASPTQISFYSASEILKIEVAGGILCLAILVLAYAAYKAWRARFEKWAQQQELAERIENGENPDPTEYPPIPTGLNKTLLFAVGGLVMLAGVAMYLIP